MGVFSAIEGLLKGYNSNLVDPQLTDTTNQDPLVASGFTKIGPNHYKLLPDNTYTVPNQVIKKNSPFNLDTITSFLHNTFGGNHPINPQASGKNIKPSSKAFAMASTAPQVQSNFVNGDIKATPSMQPYLSTIINVGKKYNIDPSILASQLSHESAGFQPQYVGGYHTDGSGRGIAGIDKRYHPEVADQQAFDPNFAIDWMGQKMRNLIDTTGNAYDALRMYNGGGNYNSNTPGYQGVPVSQRTKQYADTILQNAQALKGLKQ